MILQHKAMLPGKRARKGNRTLMENTTLNHSIIRKKFPNERMMYMIEQKQNITKEYAVAYCILAYNSLTTRIPKKDRNPEKIANEMIECMRKYKPKQALNFANKILNSKN